MKRYLLDTSALLTLRDDEPGAERVAELLGLSQQGSVKCFGCFLSLMEVLYRVWRDEDSAAGRLAYQQCLALPMEWVPSSEGLLLQAAEVKALTNGRMADHVFVSVGIGPMDCGLRLPAERRAGTQGSGVRSRTCGPGTAAPEAYSAQVARAISALTGMPLASANAWPHSILHTKAVSRVVMARSRITSLPSSTPAPPP